MDDANLSGADFTGARMVDGTAARASLDDGAREGLRAAVVSRDDREFEILAFLAGGGDRLVPLVHGLMLAYVLGREPSPDPAIPVADPDPVPETAPGRAVADERKPPAAAPPVESHEPYERIKKIELD
jgi:hypothetical protein